MSTYEMQIRRDGAWGIESFHDDMDDALIEAQRLKKIKAQVRTSIETYDEESGTFQSKVINLSRARDGGLAARERPSQEELVKRRHERLAKEKEDDPGRRGHEQGLSVLRAAYYVALGGGIVLAGLFGLIGLESLFAMR